MVRDRGYLDFLKEQKCIILSREEWHPVECLFAESRDPAHGPVNGRGSKGGDARAISLCRFHHQESHPDRAKKAFCEKYGFDWMREAAALYAVYQIWKEVAGVKFLLRLRRFWWFMQMPCPLDHTDELFWKLSRDDRRIIYEREYSAWLARRPEASMIKTSYAVKTLTSGRFCGR